MKTLEQIKTYPGGEGCNMIDGRDKSRILDFLHLSDWEAMGFSLKEGETAIPPMQFTEEVVLERLKNDLRFAYEKCEDERGISSSLMYDVIKMWMWVLDDPLADHDDYHGYGRPLYDLVAEKYGLPKHS